MAENGSEKFSLCDLVLHIHTAVIQILSMKKWAAILFFILFINSKTTFSHFNQSEQIHL